MAWSLPPPTLDPPLQTDRASVDGRPVSNGLVGWYLTTCHYAHSSSAARVPSSRSLSAGSRWTCVQYRHTAKHADVRG